MTTAQFDVRTYGGIAEAKNKAEYKPRRVEPRHAMPNPAKLVPATPRRATPCQAKLYGNYTTGLQEKVGGKAC